MVNVTLKSLYNTALEEAPSAFEAGELLRLATGYSPRHLAADGEIAVGLQMKDRLTELLQKRASGVPLQYLLGEWEFYSLPFKVGPGVLIPRQDTEALVDCAISLMKARNIQAPVLLDLCSGTGCVAIALKARIPGASVTALEFSPEAYAYLEANIALHGLDIRPVLCDLREYSHPEPLDIIVSNPPYIPRGELLSLQPELFHEPLAALDGGEDGLHYIRAIARRYRGQLKPDGALLLEVGAGQDDAAAGILAEHGYSAILRRHDLNGVARVMEARRAP